MVSVRKLHPYVCPWGLCPSKSLHRAPQPGKDGRKRHPILCWCPVPNSNHHHPPPPHQGGGGVALPHPTPCCRWRWATSDPAARLTPHTRKYTLYCSLFLYESPLLFTRQVYASVDHAWGVWHGQHSMLTVFSLLVRRTTQLKRPVRASNAPWSWAVSGDATSQSLA